MKTTATTPRKWRNVYLTRNEWTNSAPQSNLPRSVTVQAAVSKESILKSM